MADLGNQKIKDTYQLVLQTDSDGNLQKLDGSTPNPFIVNGNLRYLDGTSHPSGYVLISDGSGNASWGAVAFSGDVYISGGSIDDTVITLQTTSGNTISIPGLAWSAGTDGSVSPSGATTDVRISGNTYSNNIVLKANAGGTNFGQITPDVNHGTIKFMTKPPGTADNGESLIISQDLIEAKASPNTGTLVSYMKLQPVDGGQDIISFNDANNDIDFAIKSDNQIAFKLDAAKDMMAFRDYVGIGYSADKWPTDTGGLAGTPKYQLRVAGQTLLSGITTPLEVIGNISGTTDLYLGDTTNTASTITAPNKLTIKGASTTNDFLTLEDDYVQVFIDGASALWLANTPGDGQIILNASSKDMNTKILTNDQTNAVFVDAGLNLVRLHEHVSITPTGADISDYSRTLFVSGETQFEGNVEVSGSTYITGNTFYEGALSGTGNVTTTEDIRGTNITASNNLYITGSTFYEGTLSGTGSITTMSSVKGEHFQSTDDMSVPDGGKYILDDVGGDTYITNGGTNNNVELHANNNLLLTVNPTIGLFTNGLPISGTNITAKGNIDVTGDIIHTGDEDNKIAFGTDTQDYQTGGSSRLDISDSGVRLGGANSRVTTILDEDNMSSDSNTSLATQQSIKAYVDSQVAGSDTLQEVTDNGATTTNAIQLGSNLGISGNTFYEGALSGTGNITTTANITATGNLTTTGGIRTNIDDFVVDVTNTPYKQVGVNTNVPDANLTISGNTGFTAYDMNGGTAQFSEGFTRVLFASGADTNGLEVGDTLVVTDGGGEDRIVTVATISDSANIFLDVAFPGASNTVNGFTYNGLEPTPLRVYNQTTLALEVDGDNTFYGGALSGTGNITTTGNLFVSGNTFYEGAFSGTGDIITAGNLGGSNITASNDLFVTGDTFYEGALSGTGSITTTEDIGGTNITASNNLYVSGNTYFADSTSANDGRLNFGASDDLTIYHDGSNSYIHDSGTGRLNIKGGAGVNIISPADENMATFEGNGAVNLYYNNNLKFETTDTGVLVTGDIKGTTLTSTSNLYITGNTFYEGSISGRSDIQISDAGKLKLGDAGDLEIYHDGSNSYIDDVGTGTIFYRSGTQTFQNAAGSKTMATFNAANSVDLRYNNSLKFETTNTGILVTGDGKADTLTSTSNLYVTGNTFYEGALSGTGSITTTDKISAGTDPVEPEDVVTLNYLTGSSSYQYITFLGNTGALSDDNWQTPGTNGISNHTWGTDAGADGTTTGSTTISIARTSQMSGIRIPAGTRLVGVEGTIRSSTNDDAYYGIFTYLPDYEGPDASTATLRILAQTPSSSNNVTNDPQSIKQYASPADQYVFSDGEMIMPAIRRGSTSSQTLIGSWTLILQR